MPSFEKVFGNDGKEKLMRTSYYDERGNIKNKFYSYNGMLSDVSEYEYDAQNRLTELQKSGRQESFAYDETGNVIVRNSGNINILRRQNHFGESLAISNDTSTSNLYYGYDAMGRLYQKLQDSYLMMYWYDTLGRMTSSAYLYNVEDDYYNTYQTTQYTYTPNGNLSTITGDGKTYSYEYYPSGMIKCINYPNGLKTEYEYDNINRVTEIVTTKESTVINSFAYTYDARSNILSETRNNQITSYGYDNLNRLVSVSYPDGDIVTYTYDGANNRIGEIRSNGDSKEYIYNNKNQLASVKVNGEITYTYTYSDTGALQTHNDSTYTYDIWDRLSGYTEGESNYTYTYDPNGLRTSKNNKDYVVDTAGNVVAEGNNGAMTEAILWGHKPLGRKVNGSWYYYIYNGHGDVTGLVNDSGAVVNSYVYDPWGEIISETETIDNPIKYAGEYYDDETGFYYLRARYYDPTTGRFTQQDPSEYGYNWYVYCENNPVMFVDPTGLFGQNTKLAYNQSYSPDVVKLQRQLVSLGYLDMSDNSGWGYFGPKTQTAVNKYKDSNGLWNYGQYRGVVGTTTWEHMGLSLDNAYEFGSHSGVPEVYGRGAFSLMNGPKIINGLSLGAIETGIAKIGGDYQYMSWEVDAVNADAAMGFTANYIGAQVGARLVAAEGGFKFPIPFTDKKIYIGAEGELFGVGIKTYYKNGKLKVGATLLVGGSVIIGIE